MAFYWFRKAQIFGFTFTRFSLSPVLAEILSDFLLPEPSVRKALLGTLNIAGLIWAGKRDLRWLNRTHEAQSGSV